MHRLTIRALITVAGLLVFFCLPSIASADGVTWDLMNVTLSGGGTASGSFVYDSTTGILSDVDIATTAGTSFAGATYLAANPSVVAFGSYLGPTFFQMTFVPNPSLSGVGTPILVLYSVPGGFPNSPAGTEITLAGNSGEYTCGNSACSALGSPIRFLSGDVVAAAEPSSLLLLGLGLAGLMVVGKRRIFHA
jgi:hypothetical protein